MTGLRALDEQRAAAVEALCELLVPGSGRVGSVVYVDAVIAGMPPPVREGGPPFCIATHFVFLHDIA